MALLGLGIWIHVDQGKSHLYNLVTIDTVGPDAVNQFKYFIIGEWPLNRLAVPFSSR